MSAAPTTVLVPLDDASQVGAARRCIAELSRVLGFGEQAAGRAAIVVTELATNLLRHARDGRILARALQDGGQRALEILAVDSGPGMADVERCLRDGISGGGTAGEGLGAVRRQADDFDIESQVGAGTVVLARVREPSGAMPALRLGAICLPMAGELACGDTWAWRPEADGGALLVFDGLGHGALAADAAHAARRAFEELPAASPVDTLQALQPRLSGTRGGAAAIARIDRRQGTLHFAGIGNIGATLLCADRRRGLPSHNGILGGTAGRVQGFDYPWAPGDRLVMHSDGVQSRWGVDAVPGIGHRDPAMVAGLLYRGFARGRDDLTVVVVGE